MFKNHKHISLAIGLLYLLVLQWFSGPEPVFRFLAPAFLVFCALVAYYNKAYLQSIKKYNFWAMLRPLMLFASGFGIFFLLPTAGFRLLFLIPTFAIIFLVELNLGNFAENFLINETLIIAFGFFICLAAFNQYFPYFARVPVFLGKYHVFDWQFSMEPLYLAGVFLSVTALSRAFYESIPQNDKTKWIGAVLLGLFSAELFWVLSFLPLHYSAQAVILFSVFYFCLILNYYHLFHSLSLKKIQFHLILIILACGLVVLATPWKILT